MHDLKLRRKQLKISQARLAVVSGVSRFKICLYELGDGRLTADEQARIEEALRAEAASLQAVAAQFSGTEQSEVPA